MAHQTHREARSEKREPYVFFSIFFFSFVLSTVSAFSDRLVDVWLCFFFNRGSIAVFSTVYLYFFCVFFLFLLCAEQTYILLICSDYLFSFRTSNEICNHSVNGAIASFISGRTSHVTFSSSVDIPLNTKTVLVHSR